MEQKFCGNFQNIQSILNIDKASMLHTIRNIQQLDAPHIRLRVLTLVQCQFHNPTSVSKFTAVAAAAASSLCTAAPSLGQPCFKKFRPPQRLGMYVQGRDYLRRSLSILASSSHPFQIQHHIRCLVVAESRPAPHSHHHRHLQIPTLIEIHLTESPIRASEVVVNVLAAPAGARAPRAPRSCERQPPSAPPLPIAVVEGAPHFPYIFLPSPPWPVAILLYRHAPVRLLAPIGPFFPPLATRPFAATYIPCASRFLVPQFFLSSLLFPPFPSSSDSLSPCQPHTPFPKSKAHVLTSDSSPWTA
ncbi:hypothetical protein Mapa_016484 [Marchantia paleacea]|nr:hypothetical protein Mapa_016484 [Marchantia paleacea]